MTEGEDRPKPGCCVEHQQEAIDANHLAAGVAGCIVKKRPQSGSPRVNFVLNVDFDGHLSPGMRVARFSKSYYTKEDRFPASSRSMASGKFLTPAASRGVHTLGLD